MYDEANTNYRFEEMVTKKYFVHHPTDFLTPRRLTSATPIRGISRPRRGPFGTLGSALLI